MVIFILIIALASIIVMTAYLSRIVLKLEPHQWQYETDEWQVMYERENSPLYLDELPELQKMENRIMTKEGDTNGQDG